MTQRLRNLLLLGIGTMVAFGLSAVADLAVSAHGGDATLIHACVNPAGQLRLVGSNGSCRKQEVAVDWGQAGGGGQVPGALQVVGGDGNIVGQLDADSVVTQVGNNWFRIFPLNQEDGFAEGRSPDFLWDDVGCDLGVGTAYLRASATPGTPLLRTAQIWNGLAWHVGETIGPVVIKSQKFSDGTCFNPQNPSTVSVGSIETFNPAPLGVPPFHIE